MASPTHKRLPYMPGIDALRALAVLAVFLYHSDVSWIPGGFLGVDIFFVISGYLITSLLLNEFRRNGHINVLAFWLRRARRLLPAVGVMIAVTMVIAAIFARDGFIGMRGDALASLFYVNNWHQVFSHQSYFEQFARPSLFLHLWSLAVEEQFYLIWPLLFAAGMTIFGRRRLLWGVLAGAIASTLLMALLFNPHADPSRVYYGTDTNAATLLVGVGLALVWNPVSLSPRTGPRAAFVLDAIGVLGLALVLFWLLTVHDIDAALYRGGFLALALSTAVLLIALAHPSAHIGPILGRPAVLWLGVRSYSFYLWHWPVLMLSRPGIDVHMNRTVLLVLQFAVVALLADLSYRYVEQPFRRGTGLPKLGRFRFGRLALAATVVGVVVLVGWSGIVPKAGPSRLEVQLAQAKAKAKKIEKQQEALPGANTDKQFLALGDSVMVGATPSLELALGPDLEVNAAESRQQYDTLNLLTGYRAAGQLPPYVIIQMGNNGALVPTEMDEMRDALAGVKHVFLVNDEVPRTWETEANDTLATAAATWPNTTLLDWHDVAASNGALTYDEIHLTPEGVKAYTDLIVNAVRAQAEKDGVSLGPTGPTGPSQSIPTVYGI
jgi:peptidoglycan/LPS O-acetylase OafA/YrhL